jgi:4-oxalocrotonate tautomerase
MHLCATPEEKIKYPEKGGDIMPFINIKLIEGVLSDAQKKEMIRKVTDAAVSVEGENLRSVTWCVLEEVISGDWGIGGKGLTTADVKALAAGKTG